MARVGDKAGSDPTKGFRNLQILHVREAAYNLQEQYRPVQRAGPDTSDAR